MELHLGYKKHAQKNCKNKHRESVVMGNLKGRNFICTSQNHPQNKKKTTKVEKQT